MTDEQTATLVAPNEAFDLDTEYPLSVEAPVSFTSAFDRPAQPLVAADHDAPPPLYLRTAWKRKQDAPQPIPGRPSAKPALSRAAAQPGARGGRAHLPTADALPNPAPATPPLPSLTRLGGRSRPPNAPPVALQHAPPRAVVFYPLYPLMANPRAKPRGAVAGVQGKGTQAPGGTIVAHANQQPKWPRIQRWLGTALMVVGVLAALGALGGNYLVQRQQQTENTQFVADLSQFGPTPTPLTARATAIAARGSAGAGGGTGMGISVLPPPRPPSGATPVTPMVASGIPVGQGGESMPLPTVRAATSVSATPGNMVGSPASVAPATIGGGMEGAPTRAAQPTPTITMRPRPMGQPAPMSAPGGPPPFIAGTPPMMRPPATAAGARPAEMPTPAPRPPMVNIAPPPPLIAAMQSPSPSTTAALPAPTPPMMMPAPQMAGKEPLPMPAPMPRPTVGTEPTATPEPTPEPDSPPRQPVPKHITIPSLRVNSDVIDVGISPIVIDDQQVYIWDVAAYAVGHHFSSANPGEGDNVVLSGHDDWQGEVFRDLYRLKKGDRILVQAGDQTWSYHVEVILPLQEIGVPLEQRLNNALYIGSTGDERLTLVTCWPYGVDDHRLVVIARPDW